MRHFCTYFDSRYLTRGLALHESLTRFCAPFKLFVLCMDDAAHAALRAMALPDLEPIALAELEAFDPELLAAKPTRSTIEYYFTTTPVFPRFLLHRERAIEHITYLDADLWFFAPIEPLFEELGDGAVAIIAHRFPPRKMHLEEWGKFNVGCVIFRNDGRGRAVLESWRAQCIEWCYDRLERARFADQKYLDAWPDRFEGTVVIQNEGANVAPWNVGKYAISVRDGRVFVDEWPLLFYHFHRLRKRSASRWQLGLEDYGARATRDLIEHIYRPYIASLNEWSSRVRANAGGTAVPDDAIRYGARPLDLLRMPLRLLTRELITVDAKRDAT